MPKHTPDNPPRRFTSPDEYDVGEEFARQPAEARGETFEVETDDYIAYRNRVLEAGGLEPDREPPDRRSPDDLSPAEMYEQMRDGR